MQSQRLNKEGRNVPSVNDAWDAWKASGNSSYSHQTRRHPYACGYDDGHDDESVWCANTESFLERNTSLGRPAPVVLPATRDQDDLNQFLVQNNRWAVGDFITFSSYAVDAEIVTTTTIYLVLYIERGINDVKWPINESTPRPFLLLSLLDYNKQHTRPPSARWGNLLYHRHLASKEYTRLIKDNDKLSNYIEQERIAFKAGLLKIEG